MRITKKLAMTMRAAGYVPVSTLAQITGVTPATLYERIREQPAIRRQVVGSLLFVEVRSFAESYREAPTIRAALLSMLRVA